jgi:hypothetical protein
MVSDFADLRTELTLSEMVLFLFFPYEAEKKTKTIERMIVAFLRSFIFIMKSIKNMNIKKSLFKSKI